MGRSLHSLGLKYRRIFMVTNPRTMQLSKNVLLIALMPLVFACSKSKFTAVKSQPVPVTQTNQPLPVAPPTSTPPIVNNPYSNPCTTSTCYQVTPPPVYVPPQPVYTPPTVYNPPPQPVYQPPQVTPPAPQLPPPATNCQDYEYDLPSYQGPRALNVWVVMDGSKSNVKERYAQLKSLVETYENNLARRMPLTISVITGHSPESSDSVLSGKTLFYRHSNEPAVIRLSANMPQAERNEALRALEMKVLGMRTDNSSGVSDGGELLTVNLLAALKPSNRARAEQMGALGRGNLLNIHFMTDENDICTPGQVPSKKITIRRKDGKQVQVESEEYSRYLHCGMMDVNSHKYSQTLFNELKAINASGEAQIHLSGYIYTGENPVPRDGENEVSHGILELIQATGGRAYDLAALQGANSYNQASLAIASHLNKEGNLHVRYQLKNSGNIVSLSTIDRSKTAAFVDGQRVEYKTDSNNNYIYLVGCPMSGKKVKIKYCRQH